MVSQPKKAMIKEYLQYLADNKMYSSNTIRRYHAVLVDFAHTMCGRSWSTITRNDIEMYIASKSSASESTKASVLSAVRGVFRFACTHYGLPVNPARYISTPKLQKRVPHVVAADDITAAMKAAPKRIQLAIMLMHLCGLRVSECLSLTIEDFKDHRIIVRGKGKKERYFVHSHNSILHQHTDIQLQDVRQLIDLQASRFFYAL